MDWLVQPFKTECGGKKGHLIFIVSSRGVVVLGIVGIQWGLPGSGYLKPKDVRDEDEVPLDITLVK